MRRQPRSAPAGASWYRNMVEVFEVSLGVLRLCEASDLKNSQNSIDSSASRFPVAGPWNSDSAAPRVQTPGFCVYTTTPGDDAAREREEADRRHAESERKKEQEHQRALEQKAQLQLERQLAREECPRWCFERVSVRSV